MGASITLYHLDLDKARLRDTGAAWLPGGSRLSPAIADEQRTAEETPPLIPHLLRSAALLYGRGGVACQVRTPPLMSHFAEIRAIVLFSYCTQLPTSLECGGVEYRHDRGTTYQG